jgi:hypothetical protein
MTETPQQAWMRRSYDMRRAAVMRSHAERHPPPPETSDDIAEKERLKAEWLRRHRVKKCPPAYASFVGFWRD